jgi:hypothetical protein
MSAAFKGYLQYRNVFIGDENKDFTISYNKVYKFYDIELFEIAGNRGDPAGHIEKAIAVLREDGAEVDVKYTLRWEDGTKINGKRLWVEVKTNRVP